MQNLHCGMWIGSEKLQMSLFDVLKKITLPVYHNFSQGYAQ